MNEYDLCVKKPTKYINNFSLVLNTNMLIIFLWWWLERKKEAWHALKGKY
jgi:hypothetical protein